jgi:hypothetical protein
MVRFTMYLVWKPHHSFVYTLYILRCFENINVENRQACQPVYWPILFTDKFFPVYAMNAYGGVEVSFQLFLT